MNAAEQGAVEIKIEGDIVSVRQAVREAATCLGFGVTDTTRIVTAASELARHVYKYGGGGQVFWRAIEAPGMKGLEITFSDSGPGIPDIEQALDEGFSTGGGLGMGLPGAKRLMDEMSVTSDLGKGTTVVVKKWRRS